MGNTHSQADITRLVDEVIRSRRSVRGFLPTPVPQETILEILDVATRAPSGTNTQPWKVTVVTGARKEALSRELIATALDPARDTEHEQEYSYYPDKWVHPYLDRRRKVGYDLYGLLGIAKGSDCDHCFIYAGQFHFLHLFLSVFVSSPV